MNIYGEIRYYAYDRDFLCVLLVQCVCVCFDVTNQVVFVKSPGSVAVVSSKAINYLHLYRFAVGMNGADND